MADTSRRFSLGARLAIVIACASLPALVFLGVWTEVQRRASYDEARAWTARMAETAAERHGDFYRAVRSTLEMLAISPAVRHSDAASCAELLTETQARREWLANAWVVDAGGRVVCSTDGTSAAPELDADTRSQLARSGFAVSDIQDGAAGPLLLAAMDVPAGAGGGRIHMVVESRLYVGQLAQYAQLPEQRDAGVVIALDRRGRALSYVSDTGVQTEHVGRSFAGHSTIQALLAGGEPLIGKIHDDVERIFSVATVPEWGARIVVGIGHDTVLATSQRSLAYGAAIALLILLSTSALGWFSADRLIMRSVRVVRDAAVAMADGAMGRRAEVGRAPREVRDLAHAFNRMTERLEGLALHDQLTGLPNRRFLSAQLEEMERAGVPLAVMLLDADDFKKINDRHGHAVGDLVLKEVAERLKSAVAADGFCARVGGDEFALIVTGAAVGALPLHVVAVGERVRVALQPSMDAGGVTLQVTGSIGGAVRDGSVTSIIELFHNADRALYAAKAAGRNCLVVFDGSQPETDAPATPDVRSSRTAAA
jgi:diguanylate cyclase (GGDEF)-like protein